ncbi:MAG: trypsin-like peptidase domain-containing protein [Candidatus Pacebacteria bacterium]|nr:trypsin-like peptidase domain-containing protein [Candidatus Paceibacterota bacterium]
MKKNIFKFAAIFVVGMIGGIFANQIFWPYFVIRPLFEKYNLDSRPVYMTEIKEVTVRENTALKDAAEKVNKSVVGIKSPSGGIKGSALIVTSDGFAVTLNELISQSSSTVLLEGDQYPARVLKRDVKNNLVLLKIEDGSLPTVSFAKLEELKSGERVFLLGVIENSTTTQAAVNEGIVRSFNKDFIETNIVEEKKLKGSVLFNIGGDALGINLVGEDGKVEAIPISKVRQFMGM